MALCAVFGIASQWIISLRGCARYPPSLSCEANFPTAFAIESPSKHVLSKAAYVLVIREAKQRTRVHLLQLKFWTRIELTRPDFFGTALRTVSGTAR